MDSWLSDLRFAFRALLARPGFSTLAVLTLAIGIGVNAVAFSALNALLFKPLRFPGVEALGWIMTRSPGNPYGLTSWPDYEDLARTARTFESIAAEGRMPLGLHDIHGGTRTRQVWALAVSATICRRSARRPRSAASSPMLTFDERDTGGRQLEVLVRPARRRRQRGRSHAHPQRTHRVNRRRRAGRLSGAGRICTSPMSGCPSIACRS